MIIHDRLRRTAAHLDLRAYLLQTRSKRLNLLLLARDRRFLFLVLVVFFEELAEQHRVHRFVAHRVSTFS
jgi:hypothetical protein